MRIRLSDEDRERLGITEEWLAFQLDRLMMSEAEELDNGGYDPDDLAEDLAGQIVYGADGEPVMIPVPGSDGQLVEKRRRPARVWRAVVWIAIRNAGVQVPYVGFDFNLRGIEYAADPDEEPGKDGEAPASAS